MLGWTEILERDPKSGDFRFFQKISPKSDFQSETETETSLLIKVIHNCSLLDIVFRILLIDYIAFPQLPLPFIFQQGCNHFCFHRQLFACSFINQTFTNFS